MKYTIPLLWLALLSSLAEAQGPTKSIVEGFKKLAPEATIKSSVETPIKGIKQVTLESSNINDVFYMTDDGKYLIQGNIIQTDTKENITELSKSGARKEIVENVAKGKSIDFFPVDLKDMKHHVKVYTDIDCGYCRKLHNEMKEYNDLGIGISYLFWPRSGLQSPSYTKSVTVWCSDDQNQAMSDSQNGLALEVKQCDNPVKEHYISGKKIGINGTPSLVTNDGQLLPGYLAPKALLLRLDILAGR